MPLLLVFFLAVIRSSADEYPVLTVPKGGFSFSNADKSTSFPSPLGSVVFAPSVQPTCLQGIIVQAVNNTDAIDVKLGDFTVATQLDGTNVGPLWCTSAKGFPLKPETRQLTVIQSSTGIILDRIAVPTGLFPTGGGFKVLQISPPSIIVHYTMDKDDTVKLGDPTKTVVADFFFTFQRQRLVNPSPRIGDASWNIQCTPFRIGDNTVCTLLDSGDKQYGNFNENLDIDLGWRRIDASKNRPVLDSVAYTKSEGQGEWTYIGFVSKIPVAVSADMQIVVWGDFDVTQPLPSSASPPSSLSLPQASYSCRFTCLNISTPAYQTKSSSLQCQSPNVTIWTDASVHVGSVCELNVHVQFSIMWSSVSASYLHHPMASSSPLLQLPTITGTPHFTYEATNTVKAFPWIPAVTLSMPPFAVDNSVAPLRNISFIIQPSCVGITVLSSLVNPIIVQVNGVQWGPPLQHNWMTEIICVNYKLNSGTNNNTNKVVVITVLDSDSKAVLQNSTVGYLALSKQQWSVIEIIDVPSPTNIHDVASTQQQPFAVRLSNCRLQTNNSVSLPTIPNKWWPLHCTNPSALSEVLSCQLSKEASTTSLPLVESSGLLYTKCDMDLPASGRRNPYIPAPLKFDYNAVQYYGFASGIVSTVLNIEDVARIDGMYLFDAQYYYRCFWVSEGIPPTVFESSAEYFPNTATTQLFCKAPPVAAFPTSKFPLNASLQLKRGKIGEDSFVVIPGTFTITLTGQSPFHIPPTPPKDTTGQIAGIVIGCIIGLAVIGGGIFGYAYFSKHKRHQGFEEISGSSSAIQ